jgi:hypothetical protein
MKNILGTLERAAANFITQMDNNLQEPLVHAMKGEVFNDGVKNRLPQKSKELSETAFNQTDCLDNGGEIKSPNPGENFSR